MLLALALGSITLGLSMASAASALAQHTMVAPWPLAPGLDQVVGAVFPTPSHWIVLINQCYPCKAQSGTHREWVAESNNSGRSWTVRRTTMPLVVSSSVPPMVFASGQDAWAYGGWVSHDGGLDWAKASAPVPVLNANVEVGAGRVWTLVASVFGAGTSMVLTGAVTGDELTETKGQPFPTGYDPGTVIATTAGTVYLQANGPSAR
jgi:hypothetical protein